MELDVAPPVPDEQRMALAHALAQLDARVDGQPEGYRSAWRRTAARESTDNAPTPRYALSPRSTRGATRA